MLGFKGVEVLDVFDGVESREGGAASFEAAAR